LTVQFLHLQFSDTTVSVASVVDALLVVLAILDSVAGELTAVVFALLIGHLAPPFLDGLVDAPATFLRAILSHVSLGGVVHDTGDDTTDDSIRIDTIIVDSLHQHRHSPVDHLCGALACNFVQNLGHALVSVLVKSCG
jgi:hypothetical protein